MHDVAETVATGLEESTSSMSARREPTSVASIATAATHPATKKAGFTKLFIVSKLFVLKWLDFFLDAHPSAMCSHSLGVRGACQVCAFARDRHQVTFCLPTMPTRPVPQATMGAAPWCCRSVEMKRRIDDDHARRAA